MSGSPYIGRQNPSAMSSKSQLFILLSLLFSSVLSAQRIPVDVLTSFEVNSNVTATYEEAIALYSLLAQRFPERCRLMEINPSGGGTDIGLPLHTVVLSEKGFFTPEAARAAGHNVLLVNNAIHPGESCGVDASLMLARDILYESPRLLNNTVLVIIPIYNVGGALNRNSHTRANQNGPESYGFRGNAKHLDLNRDFIKTDSRNAQSFNKIFNYWDPDIFIDNHTSNGSDHQYTFTLIPAQNDKLAPALASYQKEEMLPQLNEMMAENKYEVIPYVYARSTPDEGIAGFLDLARYSTGYAALHHSLGFMPETHMLKPYKDRVMSVYYFMLSNLELLLKDGPKIQAARASAKKWARSQSEMAINWQLDFSRIDSIQFKGYTAKYKPSEVSGLDRLYYDHEDPFTKTIPHYNYYKVSQTIDRPQAYIIPQAYREVIERLTWNGVKMERLKKDTSIRVMHYRISDYKTVDSPYEGHYLHREVKVDTLMHEWHFRKGDVWINTDQDAARFLVETLEPQAPDSYFAWNFFDGILMQKEYFSPYIFEDLAAQYLKKDPALKRALEERKAEDEEFAKSAYAQLKFIYERSPHAEPGYRLYPVARIVE